MHAYISVSFLAADLNALLQTLRTWESSHAEVHMEITVNAPELTNAEAQAHLDRLSPALRYRTVLPKD